MGVNSISLCLGLVPSTLPRFKLEAYCKTLVIHPRVLNLRCDLLETLVVSLPSNESTKKVPRSFEDKGGSDDVNHTTLPPSVYLRPWPWLWLLSGRPVYKDFVVRCRGTGWVKLLLTSPVSVGMTPHRTQLTRWTWSVLVHVGSSCPWITGVLVGRWLPSVSRHLFTGSKGVEGKTCQAIFKT